MKQIKCNKVVYKRSFKKLNEVLKAQTILQIRCERIKELFNS